MALGQVVNWADVPSEVVRKGVDGSAFVAKPFTSDVLLRSVRATLAEPAPSPAPVAAGETA